MNWLFQWFLTSITIEWIGLLIWVRNDFFFLRKKFYKKRFLSFFMWKNSCVSSFYMSPKMSSNFISGCNKDSVRAGCKKCGYRKYIKKHNISKSESLPLWAVWFGILISVSWFQHSSEALLFSPGLQMIQKLLCQP